MPTLYILKSLKDDSYYVGSTRDFSKRMARHNSGQVKSTRNKRPLEFVYNEEFESYSEANKRERQIKSWKKRAMIEKLMHGPAPA